MGRRVHDKHSCMLSTAKQILATTVQSLPKWRPSSWLAANRKASRKIDHHPAPPASASVAAWMPPWLRGVTCSDAGQRSAKGRSPRSRMRACVRCTCAMSTSPCAAREIYAVKELLICDEPVQGKRHACPAVPGFPVTPARWRQTCACGSAWTEHNHEQPLGSADTVLHVEH